MILLKFVQIFRQDVFVVIFFKLQISFQELARRLQSEEELKAERDGRQKKELQSAVEMQDEELAKSV